MSKRYWDDLEIGDKLHFVVSDPISRLRIAKLAAATEDFSPLNLDEEFAKDAGFSCVFAPGLMSMCTAHLGLQSFAKNMNISSLTSTFQRLIRPGDRLTIHGLVLRRYKKYGEHRARISIWCENQLGEVVMKGEALCVLFKNATEELNSGRSTPELSSDSFLSMQKKCQEIFQNLSIGKFHPAK